MMNQYEQPFWILSVSDPACVSDCCFLHQGSWSISMLSLHSANQFFNISCPQVPSWFTLCGLVAVCFPGLSPE